MRFLNRYMCFWNRYATDRFHQVNHDEVYSFRYRVHIGLSSLVAEDWHASALGLDEVQGAPNWVEFTAAEDRHASVCVLD